MAEEPEDNGRSISERSEEEQTELFEAGILDGDKVTLATLVSGPSKNHAELVVSMSSAEVPLRDGLLHPDKTIRLAVTAEPIEYRERPHKELQPDGSKKIVSWRYVCQVRPVYVESLGHDALAATRKMFEGALAQDAQEAGKLLDELNARFAKYMSDGEIRIGA